MSFKKFQEDIKEDRLGNVCLLFGAEAFLVEWASGEINKKYANEVSGGFDIAEFDGAEADIYKVCEACETLPLFAEKKLVFVSDLPCLKGDKIRPDEEALAGYIENSSPSTVLVITGGEKVSEKSKLYKAVEKYGNVYEFERLSPKELRAWIKKRLKSAGKQIDDELLAAVVEESGYFIKDSDYSLYHFENDLSKLVIHSEGSVITREDVNIAIAGSLNRNVFDMIEMISSGNKKGAFNLLSEILSYGESPMSIMALLWRQYENMLNVKLFTAAGRTRGEIASLLKSRDFVIRKWAEAGRGHSEASLKRILSLLHDTDICIKSGNMEEKTALELLIAEI